mmetsp:Transcript_49177/g.111548  ORF Transcript_49177/g.111548 Transcript_49177/m.111548 type:complete len:264 (+) Transcript_49177:426-1217(+)
MRSRGDGGGGASGGRGGGSGGAEEAGLGARRGTQKLRSQPQRLSGGGWNGQGRALSLSNTHTHVSPPPFHRISSGQYAVKVRFVWGLTSPRFSWFEHLSPQSVLGRKLEVAAYGPPLRVESGGALLHLLQLEDDQAADQAAVAGMRVDAKLREVEQEASEAKRFFSTEKLRLERTVWAAQSELGRAVGALEIAKQAANEDMMQAEKRFHEQRRALESELELARAHARAAEAAMAEAEEERALEAALGEARQKEAGADGWGLGA